MRRSLIFMGRTQQSIDSWPDDIREIIKNNLQALQRRQHHSFSSIPDFINAGKVTDKVLKGSRLKGAHQLTIKDRNSYRVVSIAQYQDAVFILHAFKKKVNSVDQHAMKTVAERIKKLYRDRQNSRI